MVGSVDLLAGVHPTLKDKIGRVLDAMTAVGFPMRVCQGVRSVMEQQGLYAQGREKPGPVVTNADGVKNRSAHQVREDGMGHAVDCCFIGSDPFLDKDLESAAKWNLYGALVVAVGLKWGGNWSKFIDRPHAELD